MDATSPFPTETRLRADMQAAWGELYTSVNGHVPALRQPCQGRPAAVERAPRNQWDAVSPFLLKCAKATAGQPLWVVSKRAPPQDEWARQLAVSWQSAAPTRRLPFVPGIQERRPKKYAAEVLEMLLASQPGCGGWQAKLPRRGGNAPLPEASSPSFWPRGGAE